MKKGGIFLRAILVATFLLIIAFIIKEDLQHGTVQLASFYQDDRCEDQYEWQSIRVKLVVQDTIHSLFAATPSPIAVSFSERLAKFYEFNPVYRKQPLLQNDIILLPMYVKATNSCRK